MITHNSILSIQRIPMHMLHVAECQQRYLERVEHYVGLMRRYPKDAPGLISVQPSKLHAGLYEILDGHHRYVAHILTGRSEALCLVIEEPGERDDSPLA